MTKTDLIKHLAAAHGLTQVATGALLDDLLEQCAVALAAGDDVRLSGFGILRPVALSARAGKGPDGKPYQVAARTTVRFAPSAGLDARLPAPAA